MALSLVEIDRYERQLLVPGWGAAGQERVRSSSVRVLGDGVAAEVAAAYLAAAGVGAVAVAATLRSRGAIDVDARVVALDAAMLRAPEGCAVAVELPGTARTVAVADTHADGALLAVEALKALLGLPFAARVSAPDSAATSLE